MHCRWTPELICFPRYMRFIFPITACGISLVILLTQAIAYFSTKLWKNRKRNYQPLSQEEADQLDAEYNENEDPDLMLNKAITASTVDTYMEVNRPKGQIIVNTLEVAVVLGQIAASAAIIAARQSDRIDDDDTIGVVPAIGQLLSWIYILCLVIIRLIVWTPSAYEEESPWPKFWNHVASLYALKWVIDVFLFRSAAMHPDYPVRSVTFTQFGLSTFLFLLVILTRKGDKTVMVQHEMGLEPPRDQFASLFALATYSWLDPLIWKGYKNPLEIQD
ncbi:hypothetical protein KEM55_006991, partial [Ascosphaera atra]